ncbi:MAG: DoxX family protein [Bacteroidota bacterium]
MKKFITASNNNSDLTNFALLVARVSVAALMLSHGLPKLMQFFQPGPIEFVPFMGLSPAISLGLAVFAEVVCSVFLLAGFVTRLSVIPLAITMFIAAFSIHQADPFAKKELAVMYLVIYVMLFFAGSGKYSVDHLLQRKQNKQVVYSNN